MPPRHAEGFCATLCALALCLTTTGAAGAGTEERQAALIDFLAPQGCVISPSMRAAAATAGFDRATLDALAETGRADEDAVETGGWLVLSPQRCTIVPPQVRSEIRLTDPEVLQTLSALDEYEGEDYGERGCFIDPEGLSRAVTETRGWSREKAFLEYMRFLSENLASGEMVFYGSDLLATPSGMQVIAGECADVPAIEEMRRSHALMLEHFDRLVRADMREAVCESGAPSWNFAGIVDEVTGGENANVWLHMTINFIAMGGGWYEGMSSTGRGMPRPPLCLYAQDAPAAE